MRVGIIAEGWSDVAVIRNILKAVLGLDQSETDPLRPELEKDETSLYAMREEEFSTWKLVKKECESRSKIAGYLESVDEPRLIVVHLDTDIRFELGYDVHLPNPINTVEDIDQLCENVSSKIHTWLDGNHTDNIVCAVAVQEIDAWVLTIYDTFAETGLLLNAKERLHKEINKTNKLNERERKQVFSFWKDKYAQYSLLSADFRKRKSLESCKTRNRSLMIFCDKLSTFSESE
jgi:hypothetical protein